MLLENRHVFSLLFLKGLFLFLFFPCPSSISSQQEDWYHIEEIKWCVSPRHSFRIFFIIFPVLDDAVSFAFEFVRTRLPYASRVPQKEGSGDSFFRATGFPRRKRMSRITWSRAHGAKMESMHQGDFHAID